jgi:hypothetical protein
LKGKNEPEWRLIECHFWGVLTNFVPVDLAPFSRAQKKKSSLFKVEHFSVTDDCSQRAAGLLRT